MLWHSPWAQASAISPDASRAPGWRHFALPGKAPTQFAYTRHDGREGDTFRLAVACYPHSFDEGENHARTDDPTR